MIVQSYCIDLSLDFHQESYLLYKVSYEVGVCMIKSVGQLHSQSGMEFLKMWRTVVEPANRMLQDHRHGNFEIAMVVSGSGIYHTANSTYPIAPGDVFVFPSNEPHWILEIHDCGLEIINLHFNDALFHNCCGIANVYPNLFFAHSTGFAARIPADHASELRELIDRIRLELEKNLPECSECVNSYLNLIFVHLMREHGYYRAQDGTHNAVEKIRGSLAFIDKYFAEDITLDQIAAASGLSPNYFTSLFRQCFRTRLWDHVLSKRIDAAKKLLRSGSDLTVLDIAMSCGFHNTANFNRIFLRFTGLTPSQFRKGNTIH